MIEIKCLRKSYLFIYLIIKIGLYMHVINITINLESCIVLTISKKMKHEIK